ncbi:hypothetical protein [Clostridium thermobutyricum]|nr:hypothetical protein [Clostridium thermobutyricum]
MKTPINLDSELLNKLSTIAEEDNLPIEAIIEVLIIEFLNSREE